MGYCGHQRRPCLRLPIRNEGGGTDSASRVVRQAQMLQGGDRFSKVQAPSTNKLDECRSDGPSVIDSFQRISQSLHSMRPWDSPCVDGLCKLRHCMAQVCGEPMWEMALYLVEVDAWAWGLVLCTPPPAMLGSDSRCICRGDSKVALKFLLEFLLPFQ